MLSLIELYMPIWRQKPIVSLKRAPHPIYGIHMLSKLRDKTFVPWDHLLPWFNLKSNMDNYYMTSKLWDEITFQFPNCNGATVEVLEGINNFTHTL